LALATGHTSSAFPIPNLQSNVSHFLPQILFQPRFGPNRKGSRELLHDLHLVAEVEVEEDDRGTRVSPKHMRNLLQFFAVQPFSADVEMD
jgi:hypothetical protein